jgi:chromosome segregation ATPase
VAVPAPLSEVKHELNQTRTQLQVAREEVDTRTHAIVHLEHIVEQQDAEPKDREEQIANLLHQVHNLHIQVPPAPEEEPEEAEPMSEVDDD